MRRRYAYGYSRKSRGEPSLAWFVLGAIAIGAGYLYISGLSEEEVTGSGNGGPVLKQAGPPLLTGSTAGPAVGTQEPGGEIVRPAVPIIEDGGEKKPQSGIAWKAGTPNVMSWIPGGSYMVRTEKGISSQTFEGGFWMAVRPVTEFEYEELTGTNPVPEGKRDPRAPVTRLSWTEAKNYAVRLTLKERVERRLPSNYEYRLPAEMMWEYAAGGGEDGNALRVREEDSRDLSWWRLNGVREFRDSNHEGALRAGTLDVGVVSEWVSDSVESGRGHGVKVVRGAPHTAFLGREEEVVKSRYLIYHEDEKLPFLGFRLVMVKTGPDRVLADAGGGRSTLPTNPVVLRPLDPNEEINYVQRTESFNLEELFEKSRHSRDSAVKKFNLLREVQMELKRHGYYTARVDGYPGKSTQKAIDKFQAVVGLPKTGRLDDDTLVTLGVIKRSSETGGGLPTTASRNTHPAIPSPMPAVTPPPSRTLTAPSPPSAPPATTSGPTTAAAEPRLPPRIATPPPRATTVPPEDFSNVPRAVPARSYRGTPPRYVHPDPVEPLSELRYDGVRGKFRKLSDSLFGTYDPREDRWRR